MFYYVEGRVALLEQGLAVIDCGGVGYACYTSQNTIDALKTGQNARLYTYLHVREGIFDLLGFADPEELRFFKLLLGVSGVGPKAALAVLSVARPSQLTLAIMTEDEKLLMQAPGIGKKIAQRMILELRDKLGSEPFAGAADTAAGTVAMAAGGGGANHMQEAVAALLVLGYSQAEAFAAMEGLETGEMEVEDIIRHCLKKLAMQ